MTIFLRYPVSGWPEPPLPEDVEEWLAEHPDCEELKDQFHHGYRILVFRDEMAATSFKLKFHDRLKR